MLQIVIYKKLNFWEEYTPLASRETFSGGCQLKKSPCTFQILGEARTDQLCSFLKKNDDPLRPFFVTLSSNF